MKKGLLFAAFACSLMIGMVGCKPANQGGGEQQPSGDPDVESYEVSITNKDALQKEWRVGDGYRTVSVRIPGVVTQEALAKGDLVIASSNTQAVTVSGNQATPVGEGKATLTATYKQNAEWKDSVEVTVLKGKVYKMVSQPDEETEYLLAHKEAGGSSKLFAASMSISSNYYIGWETEEEDFPVAKVTIDEETESDYKYTITLSKTNAEGEKTEKVISVVNTAAGKFAAGFVGENDGKGHNYTEAAKFKIDEQHRLVATCKDTDESSKDLYFGCSAGYNTTGVGTDANKIVNPTRLYALSAEEIPTTSLTVTPESLTLRPNGVGELKATTEPFDTTDELVFTSSGAGLLAAPNGTISALEAGNYTVTVKSGAKTVEVPVTVEGEVIPLGTRENPLTVDEAVESLDAIGANHMSPRPLYVQGVVHSVDSKGAWNPTYKNASWWLQDENGAKKFELYQCVVEEGIDGPNVKAGDFVKAFGYGELYGSTYELTKNAEGNPANPTMYYCGEAPAVPLTDITVPTSLSVTVGQTANVTVAPVPATAELGTVVLSWKEATAAAEIVEGQLQIRGLAAGEATLVVTVGEFSKEVPVTVSAPVAGEKTDTLTASLTGVAVPGAGQFASYTDWSGKSDESDAVYAGNSATTAGSEIQLRWDTSKSKYAAIWSTTSGGHIKSVTVVWGTTTETAEARELLIYGLNTACTGMSDTAIKNNDDAIGSIKKTDSNLTFTVTGSYTQIALRSKSGAMYLESITIVWGE